MSILGDKTIKMWVKDHIKNQIVCFRNRLRGLDSAAKERKRRSREFHKGYDPDTNNVNFDIESYRELCKRNPCDLESIATGHWKKCLRRIENYIVKKDASILADPMVQFAIFLSIGGKYQKWQIPYLEKHYQQAELEKLLIEDHVLEPSISDERYHTSETLVNHLTHLTLFKEKTGADPFRFNSIFEFGGGYGSMCRLFYRIPHNRTYIIADFPIMLFLQEYYLRSIVGRDRVNLILNDNYSHITPGLINLVPVHFQSTLEAISTRIKVDLFISTWSLSEATSSVQKFILDIGFTNADYILHGYYSRVNDTIPHTDFLDFPGYAPIYHEPAFYDPEKMETYLFLKRA